MINCKIERVITIASCIVQIGNGINSCCRVGLIVLTPHIGIACRRCCCRIDNWYTLVEIDSHRTIATVSCSVYMCIDPRGRHNNTPWQGICT